MIQTYSPPKVGGVQNVIPEFQITLHSRDLLLLRKIHSFFGIGIVGEREDRNQAYYSVQSAGAIVNVIIPHFDRYPIITQKRADYLLFKQAARARLAALFFLFFFFMNNNFIT